MKVGLGLGVSCKEGVGWGCGPQPGLKRKERDLQSKPPPASSRQPSAMPEAYVRELITCALECA